MRTPLPRVCSLLLAAVTFCAASRVRAIELAGDLGSHDPSRIVECNGNYYVYSTDGWPVAGDESLARHESRKRTVLFFAF